MGPDAPLMLALETPVVEGLGDLAAVMILQGRCRDPCLARWSLVPALATGREKDMATGGLSQARKAMGSPGRG